MLLALWWHPEWATGESDPGPGRPIRLTPTFTTGPTITPTFTTGPTITPRWGADA